MKVYVCTSTDDLDNALEIEAIFTDKKQAEYYCAKHNHFGAGVTLSTYDTEKDVSENIEETGYLYKIHLYADNDSISFGVTFEGIVLKSIYEGKVDKAAYIFLHDENKECAYKIAQERMKKMKI